MSHFSILFPFFNRCSFIKFFLSFTDADFDLGEVVFKIYFKWHNSKPFLVGKSSDFSDFLFFKEKFAAAAGVVIGNGGVFVKANVHFFQPSFAVPDSDKTAFKVESMIADRFNFVAFEFDASVEGIEDFEVEVGFFVGEDGSRHGEN